MNIGGWLYVDETLRNCEQVLEGPKESVERLFYGKRVLDKNSVPKAKEFWKGGVYGDPSHMIKKVFQFPALGEQRVYEHWGMSWAISTSTDDSTGGEARRVVKVSTKQPVYSKWLDSGKDEDLIEDCDGVSGEDDAMNWIGKGARTEPAEGDVVEGDKEAEGGEGRRIRMGNVVS